MDKVIGHIRAAQETHREELLEMLRIPSVSSDPAHKADMERTAQWLLKKLQSLGIGSEIIPTAGHSIVYGEYMAAGDAPTILVYGHYDVQPVDPIELWDTPPFEPTERDGKIFARGASDDKGQLYTHILAAEAWLAEHGKLPVNLKFVIEGEEEVGSPNLQPFVEENKEKLACDAIMVSDSGFFARGVPSLVYGLRGMAYVEVIARGPNRDLHSGTFGGAVTNPADALARMIAGLHDEERRITLPGFYDDVRELSPAEREGFKALPYDEADYKESLGVSGLEGEAGFTPLEQLSARPTLEVNGMWGGFTGEGAKTVLPAEAGAKISMRLVPNQDPEQVAEAFVTKMKELAPPGIELEFIKHHGGRPFLTEPDSPYIQAGREALKAAFGQEALLTREGGSIPVVEVFGSNLKAPVVLMGLGLPDDNLHSPNEKMDLDQYHRGIEAAARFMKLAADISE